MHLQIYNELSTLQCYGGKEQPYQCQDNTRESQRSKLQRFTGAPKTAPISTLEAIINTTPLHLTL